MDKRIVVFVIVIGLCIFGNCMVNVVSAQDQELAARYAPILYFENNEKCYPVDVSYALNNSFLLEV